MIKAEVVFDGDEITCNGHDISYMEYYGDQWWEVDYERIDSVDSLEQAIKYCLEN